ncbi:Uncharacterised protein [uncultured archaeon]|nr:Uncharacterised protein [uncultured archaeon]
MTLMTIALCSHSTPQNYLGYLKERYVDCITAGEEFVNEVSVLVHPSLVGGRGQSSLFHSLDPASPEGAIPLRLIYLERLRCDVVWLRYEVQ